MWICSCWLSVIDTSFIVALKIVNQFIVNFLCTEENRARNEKSIFIFAKCVCKAHIFRLSNSLHVFQIYFFNCKKRSEIERVLALAHYNTFVFFITVCNHIKINFFYLCFWARIYFYSRRPGDFYNIFNLNKKLKSFYFWSVNFYISIKCFTMSNDIQWAEK